MVAITVVLAAVLYALIQNVLVPPGSNAPYVPFNPAEPRGNGTFIVSVGATSRTESLAKFQVLVLNGSSTAFGLTDLKSGNLGTQQGITVSFTDPDNSGTLNAGDFFTISGLHSGYTYKFDLYWKPGGAGKIAEQTINA